MDEELKRLIGKKIESLKRDGDLCFYWPSRNDTVIKVEFYNYENGKLVEKLGRTVEFPMPS